MGRKAGPAAKPHLGAEQLRIRIVKPVVARPGQRQLSARALAWWRWFDPGGAYLALARCSTPYSNARPSCEASFQSFPFSSLRRCLPVYQIPVPRQLYLP